MRVCMCGCVCMCVCACVYARACADVRVHVWLCVYMRAHVCVCVSMRTGLDGGLLAGWISWKSGMGMGFMEEDPTVAVVANIGFETSFYG